MRDDEIWHRENAIAGTAEVSQPATLVLSAPSVAVRLIPIQRHFGAS
jgi:demethoxyubiquinone hydroxylase (CLK1/Coq7/Cat5 family)